MIHGFAIVRWRRSSRCRAVPVMLLLLALTACETAPGDQAARDGGPIVLEAADVHALAPTDALARVLDLEPLADGSVWVLNSVEPFFIGFGPDGEILRTHGVEGGGPGEFRAPSGFVIGGIDGEAWAIDRHRHAVIEVSQPSDERAEVALPREAIPAGSLAGSMDLLSNVVRTARLGGELLLPQQSLEGAHDILSFWRATWGARLVALHPATDSIRTVIALADVLGDPMQHVILGEGTAPFPLWFRPWTVCSGDEIRVYDHLRNSIRGFTAEGVEIEATALPPPRFTEVSPETFAHVVFDLAAAELAGAVTPDVGQMPAADSARIMRGMLQRIDATPQQLGDLLPRYVDLRCADDGTLWIRPLDLEIGGLRGGPAWLRIAPGGDTDEVHFPIRFDPYRFVGDRIWGVQRNELDVATVAWIAMPPPE